MKTDRQHQQTRAAAITWTVLVLALLPAFGFAQGQQAPAQQTAAQQPAAQQAQASAAPQARPGEAASEEATTYPRIVITAGRSTVLASDFDVRRIAITNPAIADATVVQPREILVDAKAAGTVSLIIWGAGTARSQYDVVVQPAITTLEQRLRALYPGEDIHVSVNDEALLLSGHVSSTAIMLKAEEIAQASATKEKVINLLQLPAGITSQQVMLQVRFAEVNRHALTQLGVSFFTNGTGYKNWVGRSSTEQFAAPDLQKDGSVTFSDFLNLFLFNYKYNIGAVIQALKQTGFFQSLAEPNLIAYNGQEASFLAGGEIPVPVVQGVTNAVSVQWKEFGIRLTFRPTIAGDEIRLHVRPEVSSLDFNNGITLQGFRIPALTTRRAETDVQLRDGQSFAIAGLLDNTAQTDRAAIPILGQIPIIGNLFKSQADRKDQTELMVLITPHLVRALSPDEVPALPTTPGRFLPRGVGGNGDGDAGMVDAPAVQPDKGAVKDKPKKSEQKQGGV